MKLTLNSEALVKNLLFPDQKGCEDSGVGKVRDTMTVFSSRKANRWPPDRPKYRPDAPTRTWKFSLQQPGLA